MRIQPAIVMVKTIHRERLNSGQFRVLLREIFPEGG